MIEVPIEANFICTLNTDNINTPNKWFMRQYQTPYGQMQDYILGLWPLDNPSGIIGTYGITTCTSDVKEPFQHAKLVVIDLWDSLRLLNAIQ
ncbi:Uncharacterised protein [Yersinia pseudotuberculosis]|nr:Uncharacterised protein [Yersinia pseudotuberculosis]